MADKFIYFAYGSNMLTRRLRKRTSSAVVIETGFIEGHRLTFDKASSDGSGKCNITPTSNPGERVYGVLFEIECSEAENLDNAEGIGRGYKKCEFQVTTKRGRVGAVAYIADKSDPRLLPYDWYKEFVIAGAIEQRLPEDYTATLRHVSSRSDPDADRDTRNRQICRNPLHPI
jgi:gamma-glutamylcyclotransferase